MKRIRNIHLIVFILVITTLGYANSGPSFWQGKQSSEILTIDGDTPIKVEEENLIFDFTEEDYRDYSLSARVTANYTMSNDTEKDENIQMAFPFISSMAEFNPRDVVIEVDNEEIDFQVFLGDMLYRQNKSSPGDDVEDMKFDFESIAKSISKLEYIPQNYNLDDMGTLYKYHVVSTGEDGVNIGIEHVNEENKSKIMTKGFNGYQMIDGVESFVSRNIIENELQVFVIGEDVDLEFKAYSDVDLENETDRYSLDTNIEKVSIRDYLMDAVEIFEKDIQYLDHLGDNQTFNLFTKQLDENIERNIVNLDIENYLSIDRMDMFLVLIYEVDFPGQSIRDVSVSYSSTGTMDRTESIEPIYTFAYILNPAKNWKTFKDLNIEIRPPDENPYIIQSSLELSRQEDGKYMGSFESLPDEDLFFSLYYNEEITRMDKIKGYFSKNLYFVYLIVQILLVAFIVFIIKKIYNILKEKMY